MSGMAYIGKWLLLAIITTLSLAKPSYAWRMEAGTASTFDTFNNANFRRINFQNSFDNTPIVIPLATNQGGDSSMLRIRNITPTGFDVAPVESPGEDGPHIAMDFHYLAIEPGIWTLPSGQVIAAGTHTTSTFQGNSNVFTSGRGWDTINIGTTLGSTAAILSFIQTENSESANTPNAASTPLIATVVRNATLSSFQLSIERSESASGTLSPETIGWIAFPNGQSGEFLSLSASPIEWQASITNALFRGYSDNCEQASFSASAWPNARVIAGKVTRNGTDGGWFRRCSLSSTQIGLVVDEDIENDAERSHTGESAALIAFSDSFHANFNAQISASKTVASLSTNYALPGNMMRYTITSQNLGNGGVDNDSIIIRDQIPTGTAMRLVDITPGAGPVEFNDSTPSSGLSYNFTSLSDPSDDLAFSNDGGVSFTYIPSPNSNGVDPQITHIQISPQGSMAGYMGTGVPEFSVSFDVMIE